MIKKSYELLKPKPVENFEPVEKVDGSTFPRPKLLVENCQYEATSPLSDLASYGDNVSRSRKQAELTKKNVNQYAFHIDLAAVVTLLRQYGVSDELIDQLEIRFLVKPDLDLDLLEHELSGLKRLLYKLYFKRGVTSGRLPAGRYLTYYGNTTIEVFPRVILADLSRSLHDRGDNQQAHSHDNFELQAGELSIDIEGNFGFLSYGLERIQEILDYYYYTYSSAGSAKSALEVAENSLNSTLTHELGHFIDDANKRERLFAVMSYIAFFALAHLTITTIILAAQSKDWIGFFESVVALAVFISVNFGNGFYQIDPAEISARAFAHEQFKSGQKLITVTQLDTETV